MRLGNGRFLSRHAKDKSDMEERVFGLPRLVAMRHNDDASTLLLSLSHSSMPFIVQINRRPLVDWKLS